MDKALTWWHNSELGLYSIGYLALTLLTYLIAKQLTKRFKIAAMMQPIFISLIAIILVLNFFDTTYAEYLTATYPLSFMIGPITVALAVPLYRYYAEIKHVLLPIILTLFCCGIFTVSITVLIAFLLGSDEKVLITLTTKSITTPIAMAISENIGGIPSLAAIIVTFTGIFGAALAAPIFKLLNVDDEKVKGLSIGLTAHAIGTASAFENNHRSGAYAAIAMCIMGILTAIVLPLLFLFL